MSSESKRTSNQQKSPKSSIKTNLPRIDIAYEQNTNLENHLAPWEKTSDEDQNSSMVPQQYQKQQDQFLKSQPIKQLNEFERIQYMIQKKQMKLKEQYENIQTQKNQSSTQHKKSNFGQKQSRTTLSQKQKDIFSRKSILCQKNMSQFAKKQESIHDFDSQGSIKNSKGSNASSEYFSDNSNDNNGQNQSNQNPQYTQEAPKQSQFKPRSSFAAQGSKKRNPKGSSQYASERQQDNKQSKFNYRFTKEPEGIADVIKQHDQQINSHDLQYDQSNQGNADDNNLQPNLQGPIQYNNSPATMHQMFYGAVHDNDAGPAPRSEEALGDGQNQLNQHMEDLTGRSQPNEAEMGQLNDGIEVIQQRSGFREQPMNSKAPTHQQS